MAKNIQVSATIIIIGNEILSGRTQDVNVVTISKWLNDLGVKLEEVRVIPDTEDSIINAVNELRKIFKYLFTTGGIGPTHDDITSKSIAKTFNMEYGYHAKAYKILEKYYGKNKFNAGRKKMAMMPTKASLIINPSSGAPGFVVDNVYCLPGVPSILKSMLGGLNNKIKGGKIIFSKKKQLSGVPRYSNINFETNSKNQIFDVFWRFWKILGIFMIFRYRDYPYLISDFRINPYIKFLVSKNGPISELRRSWEVSRSMYPSSIDGASRFNNFGEGFGKF